jgi:hypothetical protein
MMKCPVSLRSVAWLGASLAACAAPDGGLRSAGAPIIGGSTDTGKDRAVVLVNLVDGKDRTIASCSGALITPRIVITSAHCAGGFLDEAGYAVYFADSYDPKTGTFTGLVDAEPRRAVLTWVDPEFQITMIGNGHDAALLLLDRAAPDGIPPLPLHRMRLTADDIGRDVRFVGFGTRADIPTVTVLEKLSATAPIGTVGTQLFGWQDSPYHTCNGDSGGPNLVTFMGHEYVAGLTMWTAACAQDESRQRVDAELPSIDAFVAANDPQPATGCGVDGLCGSGCAEIDPDCPCVADGRCTGACADPDTDPDCPLGCKLDGVCARTGCPTPDPDCGSAATGAACASNNECLSGTCVPSGASRICVPPCGADGGCPSGTSCAAPSMVCLPSEGGGCAVGGDGGPAALVAALLYAAGRSRWNPTWRRRLHAAGARPSRSRRP